MASKGRGNNKGRTSRNNRGRSKKNIKPINGKFVVIIVVVLIILAGAFAALYFTGVLDKFINKANPSTTSTTTQQVVNGEDGIVENVVYDDFQVHFLELGNDAAGDSIYIKAGDNDILIDAGSRSASSVTLTSYIDKYCKDGKLEYVISTHNHQDHIAGFAGGNKSGAKNFKGEVVGKTGVLYYYEVGTLIDFTYATVTVDKKSVNVLNKTQKSSDYGSGTEYGKYLAAREYLINNGTKYYTAKDLWDKNTTKFNITQNITMSILYNYYYFNESSDNNNHSVCSLFSYNDHNFLFTGDLELEGEEQMAAYYDGSSQEKTLPKVDLFKAGHHGSKTSSNECLLKLIQPKICVACCCAGTSEYTSNLEHQFPTQAFINRIAMYTSRVYVTSMIKFIDNEWKYTSMNGNIVVSSNSDKVALSASSNLTKLKDTEWFNEKIYAVKTKDNYTWNEAGDKFPVYQNCPKTGSYEFYTKDTPGAVLIPRRTWPSNGVK